MTEKFGEGFVANHMDTAMRLTPLLAIDPQRLDWARIERSLHETGFPGREAVAAELVVGTAGLLAAVGGLDGECMGCALGPLKLARVVRPSDEPAVYAAMDAAATLAVGLLREVSRPDGVTLSQWLRGTWAAAYIARTWARQYAAA